MPHTRWVDFNVCRVRSVKAPCKAERRRGRVFGGGLFTVAVVMTYRFVAERRHGRLNAYVQQPALHATRVRSVLMPWIGDIILLSLRAHGT